MKAKYKIVIEVLIFIVIIFIIKRFYENKLLRQEYENALKQKENACIDSFYSSSFSGVITYIKQYESHPDKYVISIKDSAKQETTIGKVEITDFSNIIEGDTITKQSNSFKLEIRARGSRKISEVKFERQ